MSIAWDIIERTFYGLKELFVLKIRNANRFPKN